MIIAVDFDGTIVTHEYPKLGELVPGAKETINTLAENGHKIFLYTMRDRDTLLEAKQFIIANDIKINKFNESPAQFSTSPKQYAHIYIDDAAAAVPVMNYKGHRVIDWGIIAWYLHIQELITDEQYANIHRILPNDR